MAYSFEVKTGHTRIRSFCVQVEAGLGSTPELRPRASAWATMKQEVTAHRAATEEALDALTVAQAVNRVTDSAWDRGYTDGSGMAYLLSGKDASADPYATMMRVPAKRATSFGYVKATEVGDRALAAAQRFGEPMLLDWAQGFGPVNEALKASGRAMSEAEDALDDPRFSKRSLVRRLNDLIAVTEAFILTQFPGRGALVDAILVPSWSRRTGKMEELDADAPPDVAEPELDDES